MVILKMNFNFKKSNPSQATGKRQEEILLSQGFFLNSMAQATPANL